MTDTDVKIRLVLADDHMIMREGLRSLLERTRNLAVVGEADGGSEAVRLARELAPDIVVMDITMPDMNGIEATKRITSAGGDVRVIGLSVHSDRRFVMKMFSAGASAYLLKDCASEELLKAIDSVMGGRRYISPSIGGDIVSEYAALAGMGGDQTEAETDGLPLTRKEREILQLVAEGKQTKDIAEHLVVSVKTVETHRQHIMQKLNLWTVAELTKFAIREGFTTLER